MKILKASIVACLILLVLIGCFTNSSDEKSSLDSGDNEKGVKTFDATPGSIELAYEDAKQLNAGQVEIDTTHGLRLIVKKTKPYTVSNVIGSSVNTAGYYFFVCADESEKAQFLVTVNPENSIITVADYYEGLSYLFPEQLVLASILPHEERHLKETFVAVNVGTGMELAEKEINFKRTLRESEPLQELYYLESRMQLHSSKLGIEIFWEQAHYPMKRAFFSINDGALRSSANDGKYSISELLANTVLVSKDADGNSKITEHGVSRSIPATLLDGQDVLCAVLQPNGQLVAVITHTGSDPSRYDGYLLVVLDVDNQKIVQSNALSELFRFQDPLIGIQGASWEKDSISYIIETKEFKYDFFWNYKDGSGDSYLRPSSFTTRYPH